MPAPTLDKSHKAQRPMIHWLAQWKPASLIAVDEDSAEHTIDISNAKRKYLIAATALESLNAVTVRAYNADGGILATRTLRSVERVPDDSEPVSPATAGGFDLTAVVVCVAKEVRESCMAGIAAMGKAFEATLTQQTAMVKTMSERHSASEKALADARELILTEREERLAEREDAAELAKNGASESGDMVKQLFAMAADPEARAMLRHLIPSRPNGAPTPKASE